MRRCLGSKLETSTDLTTKGIVLSTGSSRQSSCPIKLHYNLNLFTSITDSSYRFIIRNRIPQKGTDFCLLIRQLHRIPLHNPRGKFSSCNRFPLLYYSNPLYCTLESSRFQVLQIWIRVTRSSERSPIIQNQSGKKNIVAITIWCIVWQSSACDPKNIELLSCVALVVFLV